MAPFDNFFHAGTIFLIFVEIAKNENRLCPLPYEVVLEDIIKTVWTEQCGNLEELRYLGKAALVCLPALHFLMGAPRVKMEVS